MKKEIIALLSMCVMFTGCNANTTAPTATETAQTSIETVTSDVSENVESSDSMTKSENINDIIIEQNDTTSEYIMSMPNDTNESDNNDVSSDDNSTIAISNYPVNVSFASDMSQFADKGRSLFMMSTTIVAFPSQIAPTENKVTVTTNQSEFEKFLFDRYDWENDKESYNIEIKPGTFEFHHGWYQNFSYSGHEGMHYFLIESPAFDPKCFLEVDDDNARYEEDTNTLYLPIITDSPYSDYIGTTNSNLANDITEKSVATYGMLALDIDDYNATAENPLNLVIVTP